MRRKMSRQQDQVLKALICRVFFLSGRTRNWFPAAMGERTGLSRVANHGTRRPSDEPPESVSSAVSYEPDAGPPADADAAVSCDEPDGGPPDADASSNCYFLAVYVSVFLAV